MSKTEATKRPPIQMLESEAERLTDLAISVQDRLPEVSALLIQEIGRAKMHAADRIPADVVTMHSTVRFTHSASGKDYSYKLVYPKDADIAAGRISILLARNAVNTDTAASGICPKSTASAARPIASRTSGALPSAN